MKQYCEDHREDWELFALGTLDEPQREEMSAHLRSSCNDCAKLFMEAQAVVAALGTLPEAAEPSPTVEAKLAARLRKDAGLQEPEARRAELPLRPEKPRWNFWTVMPWALAGLFLVLYAVTERKYLAIKNDAASLPAMSATTDRNGAPVSSKTSANGSEEANDMRATIDQLRQSLNQANEQASSAEREAARLQSELKSVNLQIAALQSSLKDSEARRVKAESESSAIHLEMTKAEDEARRANLLSAQNQQMVRLLESASLHQLPLKPVSPLAGEASARVVWDDDRGLMLLAHNLPELPDQRVFQLWILRKGKPSIVSAGVVQVDAMGRGTAFVPPGEDLNDMAGVVVTDEPAGGSVSSRGSQVLLGKP
jgi:anti-sigma-K factor RskA